LAKAIAGWASKEMDGQMEKADPKAKYQTPQP